MYLEREKLRKRGEKECKNFLRSSFLKKFGEADKGLEKKMYGENGSKAGNKKTREREKRKRERMKKEKNM